MYVYQIGYGTCEESDAHELYHEEEYSKEEFRDIVRRAILRSCQIWLRRADDEASGKRVEEEGWYHFSVNGYRVDGVVEYGGVTYQDLLRLVRTVLLDEFGFTEVKYTAAHWAFGWGHVFSYDWKSDSNELNNVRDFLMENLTEEDKALIQKLGKLTEEQKAKWHREMDDEVDSLPLLIKLLGYGIRALRWLFRVFSIPSSMLYGFQKRVEKKYPKFWRATL